MKGITISDSANNLLTFDLIDILNLVGDKAIISTWALSGVEAIGKSAKELHHISDIHLIISGSLLCEIASNIQQTIDGCFMGYIDRKASPWIIIRAVDSSAFDVETDDTTTLNKIRKHFREVDDLPYDDM